MRRILLLGLLACSPAFHAFGQDRPGSGSTAQITRDNLKLRPNSRDYTIIRKGNNHQRIIQIRRQAMIRQRQAALNRKMAMEHRRKFMQQKMMQQQQIRQRMIRQREMHP